MSERISREELRSYLDRPFPEMIKFVADVEKEILALGGEMHADAEQVLTATETLRGKEVR